MSAKWRRNKKGSKWFDVLKDLNMDKNRNRHRIIRFKKPIVKMQTYPSMHRFPGIHEERKCRELKPLIDVIDGENEVIVVAEFTGFNKENLRVHVKNQRLTLSAESADRKYYKSLSLPKRVIPDKICIVYKNGVLEIRLKKDIEERTIDKLAG